MLKIFCIIVVLNVHWNFKKKRLSRTYPWNTSKNIFSKKDFNGLKKARAAAEKLSCILQNMDDVEGGITLDAARAAKEAAEKSALEASMAATECPLKFQDF